MTKIQMKQLESKAFNILTQCGFNAKQADWGVFAYISGVKTEWCTRDGYIKLGIKNSALDKMKISQHLNINNIPHKRSTALGSIKIYDTSLDQYMAVISAMKYLDPNTLTHPQGKRELTLNK
jgi:hypothetical protein